MPSHLQIKSPFVRALLITGLILPAIFPSSGRALTQEASIDANAAVRGGAVGSVSQIRRTTGRLAPFAGILPPGTPFLPSYLVNATDTSIWNHPSSDPAGIAYWPLTGKLLISDTEIEESPQPYWDGFNIFQSTLAGSLSSNCTTFTSLPTNPSSYNNFSEEPAGVTINTNNNHIFFSDDVAKKIFEVAPGLDGNYCSSDDVVTSLAIGISPYFISDPEDIAYGDNKLFIASGMEGEVYQFDLGANGVLGGGDDGSVTNFDTQGLGFNDPEGIAYNAVNGTLFIVSTTDGDVYLGETSTSGTLQRAYDLSYLGHVRRSGLTVAPASGNPSVNNVYIVSRGLDNDSDPDDYNDGKIWEISLSGSDPADLIFKDGFESNDFSAWTLTTTNGGNLNVSPSAALLGSYGMRAVITSTSGMDVTDDRPTFETRYRARFYFDLNSIVMNGSPPVDAHNIFQGYLYMPDTGNFSTVLQVEFRCNNASGCNSSNGGYQVRGRIIDDGGISYPTTGGWITITDASHFIELDWSAATAVGANDGYLMLWVDGAQVQSVTGIDNDARRVDRAKLGPVSGLDSGTSGTYYFDAFESRRQSYIGEGIPPTVVSVERADADPTNASSVDFGVVFSESVTGVDTTDFTLAKTGAISGETVSEVSGSGTTYTVTVNTGTGDGTLRLDVLDDNSIIDAYNNPLDGGFISGQTYTVIKSTPFANVQVDIGGSSQGTYDVAPKYSIRPSYAGVDSGPVKVYSTNSVPIVAALRDAWMDNGAITSSIQLMGLPENLLSDTYLFPAYNNVSLDDQLRFANVGTAPTTVTVTIGGIVRGTYGLNPSQSLRVNYAGLDSGPVVVKSSAGVKLIASIRDAWHDGTKWSSYAQLMGLPENQLSDTYLFPAYNNVSLDDQLRFGNVGTAPTIVTVTIGGIVRGNYPLNPSQSLRVSYPALDSGPVEVKSSGGVKIIASIRDSWFDGTKWTSYFQLMGLPKGQLSDTYLFPAYDNVSLDGQLRFANVDTVPTTITVTINGTVMGSYGLNPSQGLRVNYPSLDSGPIEVKSSGGAKIIASLRDSWFDGTNWTSYSQLMGLPGGQVSTVYLFPAYNNVTYDNQLRIAVP